MLSNYTVIPNEGFGDMKFGTPMDTFVSKYGEPEEIESLGEDDEYATTVLHYWDKNVSAFFVGVSNPVLAGIETDNPGTTLFGVEIMDKSKEDIISMMKNNNLSVTDESDEEFTSDEDIIRVSFDESMMDFFFQNNLLIFMNFGVMVDDNGNIEKVK